MGVILLPIGLGLMFYPFALLLEALEKIENFFKGIFNIKEEPDEESKPEAIS